LNFFAAPAVISAAYHGLAWYAGVRRWRETRTRLSGADRVRPTLPVSILKPIRGRDERFYEAIRSHALQHYPEYEILFGIGDPGDSARPEIERLIAEFPGVSIRLFVVPTDAPNGKVGVLETLAKEARYPLLLVNDSDILVEPGYLRQVTAPLADPEVGLVTCLYRGSGGSLAARMEALGVATEFAPSVLVARQIGMQDFAMGSTLALRAADLARMGGFAAIRDFLADDFQLGVRLHALGLSVVMGDPVVETWLGAGRWRDVWKHQVRWSRTVRASRAPGYFGYVVTFAAWWCLVGALTGSPAIAAVCYGVRMVSGFFVAWRVLHDRESLKRWWWMPARDLFGFAVWLAGATGRRVEWRGKRLLVDGTGRIHVS
jgi:ceramide glucosyltransferase